MSELKRYYWTKGSMELAGDRIGGYYLSNTTDALLKEKDAEIEKLHGNLNTATERAESAEHNFGVQVEATKEAERKLSDCQINNEDCIKVARRWTYRFKEAEADLKKAKEALRDIRNAAGHNGAGKPELVLEWVKDRANVAFAGIEKEERADLKVASLEPEDKSEEANVNVEFLRKQVKMLAEKGVKTERLLKTAKDALKAVLRGWDCMGIAEKALAELEGECSTPLVDELDKFMISQETEEPEREKVCPICGDPPHGDGEMFKSDYEKRKQPN